MALGPGKYDSYCTNVRIETQADGVLLIVINGKLGSGFSVQTSKLEVLANLPGVLRNVADQIEKSGVKA